MCYRVVACGVLAFLLALPVGVRAAPITLFDNFGSGNSYYTLSPAFRVSTSTAAKAITSWHTLRSTTPTSCGTSRPITTGKTRRLPRVQYCSPRPGQVGTVQRRRDIPPSGFLAPFPIQLSRCSCSAQRSAASPPSGANGADAPNPRLRIGSQQGPPSGGPCRVPLGITRPRCVRARSGRSFVGRQSRVDPTTAQRSRGRHER